MIQINLLFAAQSLNMHNSDVLLSVACTAIYEGCMPRVIILWTY